MLERVVIIVTIASLCLLATLINVVNPTDIGPFGILVFFALAYTSLLGVVTYLIFVANRLLINFVSVFIAKKSLTKISFKKAFYYASAVSFAPVILVGLQTVGSTGLYETLLTLLLVIIGCMYISKRTG